MTLRCESIMPVLAMLVAAVAIPFAIMDTIATGCVYLLCRALTNRLTQGLTGK